MRAEANNGRLKVSCGRAGKLSALASLSFRRKVESNRAVAAPIAHPAGIPRGPRSCYEEGKRFGEALCKAYHDQYGLDVRIGRLFNSYGPRLRPDGLYGRVVSRFIMQAQRGDDITVFGDGSQTRSFCYVSDTVSGLPRLIISEKSVGRAVNIGTTAETKVIDLARKVIGLVESKSEINHSPFPPGDHHRRLPDVERASRILGWNPFVDLDDGLDRTINWFRGNKPTLGNV